MLLNAKMSCLKLQMLLDHRRLKSPKPFEDAAHNSLKKSVDIYGAGWPCQPFSSMGKNKGAASHLQNHAKSMVLKCFKFFTSFISFGLFWNVLIVV